MKVTEEWALINSGFDVYNRYNTATAGWQNADYRAAQSFKNDIFKLDLACSFGVTARVDKGGTNTPTFSNIEWKITDKAPAGSDAETPGGAENDSAERP